MIYFISYDVSNPKRLNKVAKTLENFGIRIQFSFFECEMEKEQLEKLKASLLEILAVLGFLYTKLTIFLDLQSSINSLRNSKL